MGNLLSAFLFTPVFLGSLAAAGIPVLIHLIHRRRAPRMLFSALRFLVISSHRTARRRQLNNILLLILRGLLLFLFTSACFNHNLILGTVGKGPVATVIVLDNSLSMGCLHQGTSRFARACKIGTGILEKLEAQDSCALILAGGGAAKEEITLSHDLERTRLRLNAARLSSERADLPAALLRADELLTKSTATSKEVYLLTDMQQVSWLAPAEEPARTQAAAVLLVDLGRPDFSNQAVVDVQLDSRGAIIGRQAHVRAELYNSNDFANTGTVRLFLGREKKRERSFTLDPHASTEVTFDYLLEAPGLIEGRVAIDDDSLTRDNVRQFALYVNQRTEVLMVKEKEASVPFLDSAFYLKKALAPLGAGEEGQSIHLTETELATLDQTSLKRYACVILPDVGSLDESAVSQLAFYVRAGGGLVLFMGESSVKGSLGKLLSKCIGADTPPLTIGYEKGRVRNPESFWTLTGIDFEHALFSPFKNEPHSLFGDIHVSRFVTTDLDTGAGVKALASLANPGEPLQWPFLIQMDGGRGRVILFTSTCDAQWNNFPLKNLYLPLMHQLCYFLSESANRPQAHLAGEPVRFSYPDWPDLFQVEITTPAGKTQAVTSSFTANSNASVFTETYDVGIYEYVVSGAEREEGIFTINPHPEESDLRRIPEADIEKYLPGRSVIYTKSASALDAAVLGLRQGFQVNHIIFFAVLALAFIECFLANRAKPSSRQVEVEQT